MQLRCNIIQSSGSNTFLLGSACANQPTRKENVKRFDDQPTTGYIMNATREKRMHIGSKVISKGNPQNAGIITERPAIHGFWTVRWWRGKYQGQLRICNEDQLELAG
jgi:hypothetical protein